MAQSNQLTEAEKREIILTAAKTTDFSKPKSRPELEMEIARRVCTLLYLISEKSVPHRAIDAVPLWGAEVLDITFEESSKRYLMTFKAAKSNKQEPETIRSDRTDGSNGNEVKKMWSKVKKGDRVAIYKLTEETGNPNVPKVRVAPIIAVLN